MKLPQLILDIPLFSSIEYWKEIFQNAIGCTIGSGAAIVISVIIYINSIKKSEKIKEATKKEEETNHLKAFSILLSKGINVSNQQSRNVKDFIDNLSHPFIEYPLMKFIPLNDLKRIIDSITIEKTGITYMNAFSSKSNSAKEFTEILSCIDYLHFELGTLPEMMKMAIMNDYERKKEMQQIFQSSYKLLENFMLSITTENSLYPHLQEVENTLINFQSNHTTSYDIQFYYDSFFNPMHQNCIKLIQKYLRDPFVISFAQLVKEGKEKYEHILEENKRMLEDMNKIYLSINKGIDSLVVNSNTLLSSKYAS